jgi:malate/lactate dehydrogenase
VEAVRSGVRSGPVLVAVAHACGLVEALVESGLARERVLGSVAIAQSGALRRHLADELGTEPSGIAAHVLGRPPHALIAPREAATVGGVRVDARAPAALRRALGEVNRRAPGPVALAEAAACLFRALRGSRPTVLPVVAVLRGEYGHRGRALAVPAGVAAGALQEVVEAALDPVERVALDNALRGL